ncbi:hypothetical protein PFICI_04621 [Pestalotiopsis fici W106-1]|uniref:Helicase ATP-binding domain-containing protein n=1 Tax=Pestalotiopsis fici (strain W106-1 / CGMCC3.15140) TaxID=1229662 RepID=W3X9M0_PESFW|nr:uncharacterized protein PFICI_04621 [Pestalotiopsis fici W106-1]ETS82745.1 hypothetical protein PFICI_04621 [Pestalotiopsis fici W106-1]
MDGPAAKRRKLSPGDHHQDYIADNSISQSIEIPTIESSLLSDDATDASLQSSIPEDEIIGGASTPKTSENTQADVICFGMLYLYTTKTHSTLLRGGAETLRLDTSGQLCSNADEAVATLSSRDTKLLGLLQRESLELEISIRHPETSSVTRTAQSSSFARVILYGLETLGPGLKKVLSNTEYFLQDPVGAGRDVAYVNPQRLFNSAAARTSNVQSDAELAVEQEEISIIDVLAAFTTPVDLEPTEGSHDLLTPLQHHQKQALTFMRNREAGWNLTGDRTDVWSLKENPNGDIGYLNNIDNSLQYQQPPSFRGGILADNMGSGKSLSMIALIAHDRIRRTIGKDDIPLMKHRPCDNKTTLLVMPSSLLQNWQDELNMHLAPKDFKWRCHHGQSRITDIRDLEMLDIVLVTYHTVLSEWRMGQNASILFTSRWNRVILDEAHCIKGPSAVTTQAVCEIQSSSRWAVTGTPIQNNLSDLQSLLKFLQVYPYNNKDTFHNQFTNLWTNGEGILATNRLRQLLGYIMLRRSGGHIVLPDRKDLKMHLSFSEREMETYRAAKEKALEFIDDVLSSHNATRGYKNAVEKINQLRLICNHGFWQPDNGYAKRILEVQGDNTEQWSSTAAHKALNRFPSLGLPIACVECSNLFDHDMSIYESQLLEPMSSIQIYLTRCLRLCPSAANENRHFEQQPYPTKIRALLDNVQKLPKSTKSIVFSFWKSTLDIARTVLNEAGIACVQIDGKVKPKNRKIIFEKFQTDETTRILLLSLSCGAVGLTLTAASRVYLMEPQWNPSLEEQALARVYRIGQKQDVTTIRFLMKDSIEKVLISSQKAPCI